MTLPVSDELELVTARHQSFALRYPRADDITPARIELAAASLRAARPTSRDPAWLCHLAASTTRHPRCPTPRRHTLSSQSSLPPRPGGRRLLLSATSRRRWRSRAISGSRESSPRASTPLRARPPNRKWFRHTPPPRNPPRSPADGQRRPTASPQGPSSSRAESNSTLIPAGSAEFGLTRDKREQLRLRRSAPPSPSSTGHRSPVE